MPPFLFMKRKTKEQFIEENYYEHIDYSNVEYKNNNTKIKLYCKKHNVEFEVLPRNFNGNCPICGKENKIAKNKKQRKNTKWFVDRAVAKWGKSFNYSKTNYVNARTEVKIICNTCGNEFSIIPRFHFYGDGGCNICGIEKMRQSKILTQEEVIERCKESGYDCSKIVYKGCREKIELVCNKHGSFWMLPYNVYGNNQKCPHCYISKLEEAVRKYLDKNNIKYDLYKTYNDLVDDRKLSYDFYLVDKNILIECQGQQHYEKVNWSGDLTEKQMKENLKLQFKHDKLKREYAYKNNIKLVCLPYWEFDNYENILKLRV